jgi:hypothetical protein
MRKAFIIRGKDWDKMYRIVQGTCRSIIYERDGMQMNVVLNGIGFKDFLRVRKPLKRMSLYW